MQISMTVNSKPYSGDVEPRLLLVDFQRDSLGLTGTKVGCDTGQCGSCTIIRDDVSVKSCTLLAVQADGADLRTVEGLAQGGVLNRLQEGFWERHGLQCGFCTPGMLMSLTDMLEHVADPGETEIRTWLDGNLCRCTGYQKVVEAVQFAVQKTTSPVHMIVDTPGKRFYENQVRHLLAGDADGLVDDNYHPDAVVASFDFQVTGHEALKAHFRNYLKWVRIEEIISTDKFTESDDKVSFEATVRTNHGVFRVYDVFTLKDGKAIYHFTGVR
jgi:aerobic carbon-monoxide dehydrogenase small subunit